MKDTHKGNSSLEINQGVQKNIEKMMDQEIKENIINFKKEIKAINEEIIESYRAQFNAATQEIKPIFSKNFQELNSGVEKFKSQIDDFGQTISDKKSEIITSGIVVQKEISKSIQNNIKELNKKAEEEISKIEEVNLNARNSIIDEAGKEFEALAKELDNKFSQIYQSTQEILDVKVKKAEEEIENYKKERLKTIEKEIYQIVKEVAKETIGVTIDLSTHEKLLTEALRKAEKEKIL